MALRPRHSRKSDPPAMAGPGDPHIPSRYCRTSRTGQSSPGLFSSRSWLRPEVDSRLAIVGPLICDALIMIGVAGEVLLAAAESRFGKETDAPLK